MDLFDQAKSAFNKITGQESPQGDTRPISTTVSNAKVVYWHYVVQNFGSSTGVDSVGVSSFLNPVNEFSAATGVGTVLKSVKKNYLPSTPASDEDVFKVEKGILDAEIVDIQVSKSIGNPSGSFRISLLASSNWKRQLAPGDWLAIYMFQDSSSFNADSPDSKNMVMLGCIDRISKTKQREEDTDKVIVRYVISGRDFGKVLEDACAWFNPFVQSEKMKQLLLTTAGVAYAGNPSSVVRQLFGLFFGQNSSLGQFNIAKNINDSVNQALVPSEIVELFSSSGAILDKIKSKIPGTDTFSKSGGEFYSALVNLEIDENLPGFKPRGNLGQASGGESIWSILKREANCLVNDLYVDLFKDEDGNVTPTLALTPHPNSNFFQDPIGALNGAYLKMTDLYEISMPNSRIKYEDLGRDDNSRFNMIWLESRDGVGKAKMSATYIGAVESNGIGLPMYQRESIIRYGLKIWDQMLENCYESTNGIYDLASVLDGNVVSGFSDAVLSIDLYRSFINQIYDLNIYNHLYETGSLVTIGDPRAQLGACLRIKSDFDYDDRLYFVEGYTHTWTYPGQWETEWNVTHGQFDNELSPFIDVDESDGGQPDGESNRRYLVKTNFKRPEKLIEDSISGVIGGVTDKLKDIF